MKHIEPANITELHKYFLSVLSHDLKSPLTSIMGFARILKSRPDIDSMIKEKCYGSIIQESERMVRIINNMLTWEQIKQKKLLLSSTTVNFSHLVKEISINCLERIDRKNLYINIEDNMSFSGDYDRIKDIIENIMGDLLLFTEEGGQVDLIAWKEDEHHIKLVMSNTIFLLDPFIVKAIFKRKKPSLDTIDTDKGRALSFIVVRSLVELHGGTIKLEPLASRGYKFSLEFNI
ncbi:MAG: HAMP domain-containing sensor histidine kinase [Candidatus Eremiobacterota bacterium]